MQNNNSSNQNTVLIVAIDQQNSSSSTIKEICQLLQNQQKPFQVFEESANSQKIVDQQLILLDSANEIWQEKIQKIFSKQENFSPLKLLQDAKNLSTNPLTQSLIDLEIKAYEKNPQQFDKLSIEDFSALRNALANEGKSLQIANDFKIKNQKQGVAIIQLNPENVTDFASSISDPIKPIILANPKALPATNIEDPDQVRGAYDFIHLRALESKGEVFRYGGNQQDNTKIFQAISEKLSLPSLETHAVTTDQKTSWREKISSSFSPKDKQTQIG